MESVATLVPTLFRVFSILGTEANLAAPNQRSRQWLVLLLLLDRPGPYVQDSERVVE